jgi:hypothetical protein
MDRKSSTEAREPILAAPRTLRVLPSVRELTMDSERTDPTAVRPCTDKPEPILANCRSDNEEPIAKKLRTDAREPHRPVPRTLKVEPIATPSIRLTEPPARMPPMQETDELIRAKARRDNADPTLRKSSTLARLPKRVWPRTDNAEPRFMKFNTDVFAPMRTAPPCRMERHDPRVTKSLTDSEPPSCAKDRSEILEPKCR